MKICIPVVFAVLLFQACNQSSKNNIPDLPAAPVQKAPDKQNFFPVTEYIRGQMAEITQRGITPKWYVTVNNHTDSSWLRTEAYDKAFNEFLHPVIDSANLITLFTEKQFMDQTIDAFTFTYDPIGALPDSMLLQHWDIYVEPKTGKVRRVYLVKNSGVKTIQLTWQGDKWCRIVHIINKPDGTSIVEREEKITWEL